MTSEAPPETASHGNPVLALIAPVVLLIIGAAVWSGHFQSSFHLDDIPTIVNNRAVTDLKETPRVFVDPRAFSSEPEQADYKPLLSLSFAADAAVTRTPNSVIFQADTFGWFGLLIFCLYLLLRLIPGSNRAIALFATALFAMHPIAAETLNYVSQRGKVLGTLGIVLGLVFWIVWPARLPKKLGLNLDRVPQTWMQYQIRQHGHIWEDAWKRFLRVRFPFYLLVVAPTLLAEPSAAIFPLLVLVYMQLFDRQGSRGLLIPGWIVCGVYWICQTVVAWRASPLLRIPLAAWLATQPWVAMHYLFSFFAPLHLSADSDMQPAAALWAPSALAGYVGVAAILYCAVAAGKASRRSTASSRNYWALVSYGLWWFLIALLPFLLIPQRTVEADPRMFTASLGLALVTASLLWMVYERLLVSAQGSARVVITGSAAAVCLVLLSVCGWLTWQRNEVWRNEESLWRDVIHESPNNLRAYVEYADLMFAMDQSDEGIRYLNKAVSLPAEDGVMQVRLAREFDKLNDEAKAEAHFRKAIALAPTYSGARSYFSQWLLTHQRGPEALQMASKALTLNSRDLVARHTLMDINSQRFDWTAVQQLARETLRIEPNDAEASRALVLADTGVEQLHQVEQDVKNSPNVDDFLKLSALYYRSHRYEDSVKAAHEAVKLRPDLAEGYINLATGYYALKKLDETISNLQEAIRLRPDFGYAKSDLQIVLEEKARQQK